jgi:hypothetical protein
MARRFTARRANLAARASFQNASAIDFDGTIQSLQGHSHPRQERRKMLIRELAAAPRRGLSRDEAAMYIGIGATKFDEMVIDGRMPAPVKIDARRVWDIRSLDLAFDELSTQNRVEPNSWDGV